MNLTSNILCDIQFVHKRPRKHDKLMKIFAFVGISDSGKTRNVSLDQ